jgi:hypothetical protein
MIFKKIDILSHAAHVAHVAHVPILDHFGNYGRSFKAVLTTLSNRKQLMQIGTVERPTSMAKE